MEEYKNSEMYKLLNNPMLTLNRMKSVMEITEPGFISRMIQAEPETVFLIDYYFRLFPGEVAGRILNDPGFSLESLTELFNCQIIRFYRSELEPKSYDKNYSSLGMTFWKFVDKNKLMQLLSHKLEQPAGMKPSIVYILQELNVEQLEKLAHNELIQSKKMLEIFKNFGEKIIDIIALNLDLFDFIQTISSDLEDYEYMEFLNGLTRFIVQLRIAESMVEESKSFVTDKGRIPLKELIDLLEMVPADSLQMTLHLLLKRDYIDESTINSIKQLKSLQL
jgi:hypothetical protein